MIKEPYYSSSIVKLSGSRLEIIASVPSAHWECFRAEALKKINNSIKLDGFRSGMIPETILISKLGEMAILEETAELALPKIYLDILINSKINAIGKPQIQITKLAKNNPLEFKAITAVIPEIKLPDYREIAKKEIEKRRNDKVEVKENDIEEAVLRIRKQHASHASHSHDHAKMTKEEHDKAIEASMPVFNDEFVQGLGEFNNVEDFKKKLGEILLEQKKDEAREKTRIAVSDILIANTIIELPEIMIESELNRTQAQFQSDIERMGVKLDDYLKHAKKSLEDIRKEWRPYAEKKAKLQLILNEIANKENIKPMKEEIEREVNHLIEHYKDANREDATIYAETMLTNNEVYRWLGT